MAFVKLIKGVRDVSIIIMLALLMMMAGDVEKIADAQTCNQLEIYKNVETI